MHGHAGAGVTMTSGKELQEHLERSPAAIAYRTSWEGKAHITYSGIGLQIHGPNGFCSYPYAFSFEDFTAEDWELA